MQRTRRLGGLPVTMPLALELLAGVEVLTMEVLLVLLMTELPTTPLLLCWARPRASPCVTWGVGVTADIVGKGDRRGAPGLRNTWSTKRFGPLAERPGLPAYSTLRRSHPPAGERNTLFGFGGCGVLRVGVSADLTAMHERPRFQHPLRGQEWVTTAGFFRLTDGPHC